MRSNNANLPTGVRIGASITVVARTPRPCGPFLLLPPFCRTDEASVLRVTLAKLRQLLMHRSLAVAKSDEWNVRTQRVSSE